MNPPQSNPSLKRPRGRPKGTTKFEQEDRRHLAEFADRTLGLPHAVRLAPFLVQHGYEERDVRRAQKRWREEKPTLLREAQLRADAAPPESIVELIIYLMATLSPVTEAVRPAFAAMADRLERARRQVAVRKEQGLDLGVPLDLAEPGDVEGALRRYEATVGVGHKPAEFGVRTLDELPLSLKLYAAALMLHETSLSVAEAERREATASGGKVSESREGER
ncbi:hypothetical protein V5F31_08125 [Xanthobacter sp. V7C-4]|uniref:hypothetical protein n=1 Tax=Xanthobacter autotrophicus (strain ATCC BAA-1158 / Py2) TaxID=78245 RepID=UPI00372B19DD